jgi:hypothetical protein
MLCWTTASGIAVLRNFPSRAPVGQAEGNSALGVVRANLID